MGILSQQQMLNDAQHSCVTRYPVDVTLFDDCSHSPSLASLERSMNRPDLSVTDFCIPVNLYFPPESVLDDVAGRLGEVLKFYPERNHSIAKVFSESSGLDASTMVMANGSTELIAWITQLFVRDTLLTPVPTFGRWTDYPAENGKRVVYYQRSEANGFALDLDEFVDAARKSKARAVAISNPNNPTGNLTCAEDLCQLLDCLADRDVVVIDESFLDFSDRVPSPTMVNEAINRSNVIVIKSLGKNFGLHGMRVGYAVTNSIWAERLRNALPAWNVNALAETMISLFCQHQQPYEESRWRTIEDRQYQQRKLGELPGFRVYPSDANFVYVRIPDHVNGTWLRNHLLTRYGFLLRECGNKIGANHRFFRIATRSRALTRLLCQAMRHAVPSW